jgi:hypothetical protein
MSEKDSKYLNGGPFMAANAIPNHKLNVNAERGNDSYATVTVKQGFAKLIREVFEGH